ncbi:hypothetical protein sos41_31500 [Alphaproteobacteria bacterium SO-S41]|nr:hypothetical protein sos41_31500 [Alphaproteobacteria bacterium SO-S41]
MTSKLPKDMPAVLAIVARAAGLSAAKALAEQKGGVRIFVPKSPKAAHFLTKICTPAGAEALGKAYGGERIDVPLWTYAGIKGFLKGQRRAILDRDADGQSASQIARGLHCSGRVVHKVRSLKRRRLLLPDLFDES